MPWEITRDAHRYAEHSWELLSTNPVENTLALTTIEAIRAPMGCSPAAGIYGLYRDDGKVRGAVSRTPPFELNIGEAPAASLVELAEALCAYGAAQPGVNGRVEDVRWFTAAWTSLTSSRATLTKRLLLYLLDSLRAPPRPAGRARRAEPADFDLVLRWMKTFYEESLGQSCDLTATVRTRIDAGLLWLWENDIGEVVCLAGSTAPVAGVARIAPFYTPPDHRGRGYGAAALAACTADAVRRGVGGVVLFADMNYPTSNAIFKRTGYHLIGERVIATFTS